MTAILLAKLKHLFRNPWAFLGFTGISIVFALIMGLTGFDSRISVPVVIADEEVLGSSIHTALNDEESISFKEMEKDELIQSVKEGKAEVGAILKKDTYELIVGVESTTVTSVDNMIRQAYTEYGQRQKIIDHIGDLKQTENALQKEMDEALKNPVFSVTTSNFTTGEAMMYDPIYQYIFGFGLFFVIYTVAYNVLPMLIEKQEGVWDRLILSPVKKWKMYAGNMIYSFCIGYLQVFIIFSFFYFVFGVNFNGKFPETLLLLIPYVFTIVALSILLTAIVKNSQQFNAFITILAVCMAMIGGAYWPIEIVESNFLISISKINPLTYGMEILHGVVNYGYSLEELFYPMSILLLMGIVMIGVGIHLMERRHI